MTNRIRCARCARPLALCYCSQIPTIDNLWPVHILQHPQETRHALGTARIARLGLAQCTLSMWERARPRFPENHCENNREQGSLPQDLCGGNREQGSLPQGAVLIYPGDNALPVSALAGQAPRPLIFLDATWRKSRRMILESPELDALPRYVLDSPPPSRYRIRKEPTSHSVSTLEAVVHALGQLENTTTRYEPLLRVMDALIEQQIQRMGQSTFAKNYDGCVSEGE